MKDLGQNTKTRIAVIAVLVVVISLAGLLHIVKFGPVASNESEVKLVYSSGKSIYPLPSSTQIKQDHEESWELLHRPQSARRCLSFEEDLDKIVKTSRTVYLLMLPKAGGTTTAKFAKSCTKNQAIRGNFLNNEDRVEDFLTSSLEMPRIIASHIYIGDKTLKRIMKQTTRDDLIIYIHREETDRVMSSIKMIVEDRLCRSKQENPELRKYDNLYRLDENANICTIPETILVDITKNRLLEISRGVHNVLTCNAYETIEDHAPNMIFMDFRQIDKLQHILATHHCPRIIPDLPIRSNVSADKKTYDIRIDLQHDEDNVRNLTFSDWLDTKRELMEWALDMKQNVECLAKTRVMENDLMFCSDNLLQVSSSSFSTFEPNI